MSTSSSRASASPSSARSGSTSSARIGRGSEASAGAAASADNTLCTLRRAPSTCWHTGPRHSGAWSWNASAMAVQATSGVTALCISTRATHQAPLMPMTQCEPPRSRTASRITRPESAIPLAGVPATVKHVNRSRQPSTRSSDITRSSATPSARHSNATDSIRASAESPSPRCSSESRSPGTSCCCSAWRRWDDNGQTDGVMIPLYPYPADLRV